MNRRGQSLVESMLVLAAFLTLLLGVVHVDTALVQRQALLERVRQAVRWAATHPRDPQAVRELVAGDSAGGLKDADIDVSYIGCPGTDCRVRVAVAKSSVELIAMVE